MNIEELTQCAIDAKITLANHETRLTSLQETVKDIRDITLSIKEIVLELKQTRSDVSELKDDVTALKEEPKKNWGTFKTAVISAMGGSFGTAIIGGIIFAFTNVAK